MRKWTLWAGAILASALLPAAVGRAAERMALVIGNGAYPNGNALDNPPNDARLIAESLRGADFSVTLKQDLGLEGMREALERFQSAARTEGAKVAAVYYAGHGTEIDGQNYLVPTDAVLRDAYQVKTRTLPLDELMNALDSTAADLKIVVLDCCRSNPFGRSFSRDGSAGLAALSGTPRGTIISYATAPGRTAQDGASGTHNSPYAAALAKALAAPGLTVLEVFQATIGGVEDTTSGKQSPWFSANYRGRFVFHPGMPAPVPMVRPEPPDIPAGTPAFANPAYADAQSRREAEQKRLSAQQDAAEARLTQAYESARTRLGSSARENLRQDELRWIKRKDAYPSGDPSRIEMIERRAQELSRITPDLSPPAPPATDNPPPPSATNASVSYRGSVGRLSASFDLKWLPDDTVVGTYYYPTRSPRKVYTLRGRNYAQGQLQLEEYTDGVLTARISLSKQDSAGRVVWEGQMHNTDGRSFQMSMQRD